MLLDQTGAKHSQSPVEAEGGAVMVGTKFPLCPGVDINRISLCKAFVRMSVRGQERRFEVLPTASGLHQSTDIIRPAHLVRLVP
jgi:hypothetical protein